MTHRNDVIRYSNLSQESKADTVKFFGLLNFLAENFIFSYIGMSFFTFPCHRWDAGFIGWSIASIVVVRIVMIYPLSFVMNMASKPTNQPTNTLNPARRHVC